MRRTDVSLGGARSVNTFMVLCCRQLAGVRHNRQDIKLLFSALVIRDGRFDSFHSLKRIEFSSHSSHRVSHPKPGESNTPPLITACNPGPD